MFSSIHDKGKSEKRKLEKFYYGTAMIFLIQQTANIDTLWKVTRVAIKHKHTISNFKFKDF
jgi:hypothetical protein